MAVCARRRQGPGVQNHCFFVRSAQGRPLCQLTTESESAQQKSGERALWVGVQLR